MLDSIDIGRWSAQLESIGARMSRPGKPGRPPISEEIRELIRKLSGANPLWGTPRIVGELGKLGIDVAKLAVNKYRVRPRRPSSSMWKALLKNHVTDLVSIDFFIVPTIRFKLLFVVVSTVSFTQTLGGSSPQTTRASPSTSFGGVEDFGKPEAEPASDCVESVL